MFKRFLFYLLPGIFTVSCNNKTADQQSTASDSSATKSQPAAIEQSSTLPAFVVFRNWEQGILKSAVNIKCLQSVDSDQREVCQLILVTQPGSICQMAGDLRYLIIPLNQHCANGEKIIKKLPISLFP